MPKNQSREGDDVHVTAGQVQVVRIAEQQQHRNQRLRNRPKFMSSFQAYLYRIAGDRVADTELFPQHFRFANYTQYRFIGIIQSSNVLKAPCTNSFLNYYLVVFTKVLKQNFRYEKIK